MRVALLAGLILWVGSVLVLSEVRWFSRGALADRLRPYTFSAAPAVEGRGLLSFESFRDVIGPLSSRLGDRLSRLFGVSEDLGVRLARAHSPYDVTTFRVRQLGAALAALVVGAVGVLIVHPPVVVGLLVLLVSKQSTRWQRRVFLELPVVAEQLATLLASGYSLGGALNRLAHRGHGACAQDLRQAMGRVRQGLTEVEAVQEWAAVVRVDALDRLVPVLALNSEAADLGRLISEEARSIRKDVQRELVETMERRAQTVWIPVTVATLVPGVILLAIPFTQALKLFTA
jgi:tight adherence protein C